MPMVRRMQSEVHWENPRHQGVESMSFRCVGVLLLIFTIAAPAISQDAADKQEIQDAQNPSDSQATTATQGTKTENPAEPEAHGSRLQWKDLPKNIWKDQK